MPSTSKKQHNFMAAVANNPAFAKKVGVPQSVGKDFNNADKGRKFSKGGSMPMKPGMRGFQTLTAPMTRNMGSTRAGAKYMKEGGMAKADMKQDKGMMQKAVNKHEGRLHKGSPMTKLAGGGMAASKMGSVKSSSSRDGIATKGKTKGTMITMKNGGKC